MENLRYPLGRFDPKQPLPPGGHAVLIRSLASTPIHMRRAVAGLTEEQVATPYREGGWSVRQLVHHVPDSHMNAYVRMKWGLTESTPLIKTYDEKAWSELPDARTAPIDVSLDLLEAVHRRWDMLLEAMTDQDFARTVRHPDWGEISLTTLLQLYEWHGRHHVAHITGLRERRQW
ncbi:MAG TPA: putative metal-dependent hydrolase [Burkholderiales bacterium]|nr:putative metal-dependent hydrolase [Burkholderiales bacterium]